MTDGEMDGDKHGKSPANPRFAELYGRQRALEVKFGNLHTSNYMLSSTDTFPFAADSVLATTRKTYTEVRTMSGYYAKTDTRIVELRKAVDTMFAGLVSLKQAATACSHGSQKPKWRILRAEGTCSHCASD